jgi:hypothetical protein
LAVPGGGGLLTELFPPAQRPASGRHLRYVRSYWFATFHGRSDFCSATQVREPLVVVGAGALQRAGWRCSWSAPTERSVQVHGSSAVELGLCDEPRRRLRPGPARSADPGLAAGDERAADPGRWTGENLLGFALMAARGRLTVNWGQRHELRRSLSPDAKLRQVC